VDPEEDATDLFEAELFFGLETARLRSRGTVLRTRWRSSLSFDYRARASDDYRLGNRVRRRQLAHALLHFWVLGWSHAILIYIGLFNVALICVRLLMRELFLDHVSQRLPVVLAIK
jgi:hypothetical protein